MYENLFFKDDSQLKAKTASAVFECMCDPFILHEGTYEFYECRFIHEIELILQCESEDVPNSAELARYLMIWPVKKTIIPTQVRIAPYFRFPSGVLWHSQILFNDGRLPLTFVVSNSGYEQDDESCLLGGADGIALCGMGYHVIARPQSEVAPDDTLISMPTASMPALAAFESVVLDCHAANVLGETLYWLRLRSGASDAPSAFFWDLYVTGSHITAASVPQIGDIVSGTAVLYGGLHNCDAVGTDDYDVDGDFAGYTTYDTSEDTPESARLDAHWQPSFTDHTYAAIRCGFGGLTAATQTVLPRFVCAADYFRQLPEQLRRVRLPNISDIKHMCRDMDDLLPRSPLWFTKHVDRIVCFSAQTDVTGNTHYWRLRIPSEYTVSEHAPCSLLVALDDTYHILRYTLTDRLNDFWTDGYGGPFDFCICSGVNHTETHGGIGSDYVEAIKRMQPGDSFVITATNMASRLLAIRQEDGLFCATWQICSSIWSFTASHCTLGFICTIARVYRAVGILPLQTMTEWDYK